MEEITTRKALLISAELEKRVEKDGMSGVRIFKGTPSYQYRSQYWATVAAIDGFATWGTYGHIIANANTLSGLLDDLEDRRLGYVPIKKR